MTRTTDECRFHGSAAGLEVTLEQMLRERENRAGRQRALLGRFSRPVLCFTMNIPGPVKDSPLIRRGFAFGRDTLNHRLPKNKILFSSATCAVTGCEALYAVDMDALSLKKLCVTIEDELPLGRLWDMDVLDADGTKLERSQVGGKSRDCIVCGAPGRACASRRAHRVEELQAAVRRILSEHFAWEDAGRLGAWAVQSLLDELLTTPKPGLVDRRNSGSHQDMDVFTFAASAAALAPYFRRCAQIGQESACEPGGETFRRLRAAGLRAEQDMFAATGGVNTHKGAIFTMGILCGAAGRLWKPEGGWEGEALFREVSAMTAEAMAEDLRQAGDDTAGQRIYARTGIAGIREEAARGFPSVADIGIPTYRNCLETGMERNMAGVITLLHLITQVQDTNMISRGGMDGAKEGAERVSRLLKASPSPAPEQLEELDDWFIRRNLSPGGCADLLAAVYFVARLTSDGSEC